MRQERLLHFERGNVLTAAHNNVFLAISDEDAPILADRGHVPGMKPATAHRFRRGRRLLPVALHATIGTSDNTPSGTTIISPMVFPSRATSLSSKSTTRSSTPGIAYPVIARAT